LTLILPPFRRQLIIFAIDAADILRLRFAISFFMLPISRHFLRFR
jgi:hypothetical protein